jgi:PAS domain S-box-containing protein
MQNRNLLESILGGKNNFHRFYALLAAVVIFLARVVISPDIEDSLVLRILMGAYFFGIFVASFLSPKVNDQLKRWFSIGIVIMSAWVIVSLWMNKFAAETMAGYQIMTVFAVILIAERTIMIAFAIVSSVGLVLAVVTIPEATPLSIQFVSVNILLCLVGVLSLIARSREKRQMEKGLNQSLTVQQLTIESSAFGILLVDEDGGYIKANSAFLTMWSIPEALILANNTKESDEIALRQVKDPKRLKDVWLNPIKKINEGVAELIEMANGRTVEVYWRQLISEDQPIGRLWFFRDVTRQKAFEQRLLNTEKRLREQNEHLMELASSLTRHAGNREQAFKEITSSSAQLIGVDTVGIWFFEPGQAAMKLCIQYDRAKDQFTMGTMVRVADHVPYFDALLSTRVMVVPNTLLDPVTTDFYEGKYTGRASALMHTQIRSGSECIGVMTFEQADATRAWTPEDQSYATSLGDLVAISLAAAEKQQTQSKLTNSMAILRAIFDLSETGIIVEDRDHNILNYNELYLKIWNFTAEFVDNNPYKTLVEHCLSQIRNSHAYVEGHEKLKLKPDMEYAGIIEFHDGRIIERYSKAIKVDEFVEGRVWFYLDITERKNKENELINRNFELDSFVYRASHDLKAPLNSVMGLIGLIRQEKDLDSIIEYVTMMDKSVKKLDEFIRQLTQFSQDARLKIICKPIRFREMVDDILSDLKFMDGAARLNIVLDIEQEGTFYSDPVRLGIIMTNILSNAIKYQDNKKEKSTLFVQIRANETEANCRFADNGLGIDAEHLEKVFDLFYRASIQASGSGLGLYITHNAVHKLGGRINVVSKIGEGSSFELHLPSLSDGSDVESGEMKDISKPTV